MATASPVVKRGFTFTHRSMLDPTWKPAEGQKYADGPKAVCIVTRVTKDTVWFGYLGDENPGGFIIDRRSFEERYMPEPEPTDVERALIMVEAAERTMRFVDTLICGMDTRDKAKADQSVLEARLALDLMMERTTTLTCSLVKDQALSDRISHAARDVVRPIREAVREAKVRS